MTSCLKKTKQNKENPSALAVTGVRCSPAGEWPWPWLWPGLPGSRRGPVSFPQSAQGFTIIFYVFLLIYCKGFLKTDLPRKQVF